MTTYTFETATQADANRFGAGDLLHFETATPLQIEAVYVGGTPLTAAAITLSYGGKTLTFRADALGEEGSAIDFRHGGVSTGALVLLGQGPETISIFTNSSRAIWGFDGNDHVTIAGPGTVAVHGGAGDDLIVADNAVQPGGGYYQTGTYFVDGGAGDDSIALHLATGAVDVWGGTGKDTIEGGASNDHLYGNARTAIAGAADGDDSISGGDGNDYIQGNAGDDWLYGETGNDRIYGGSGEDYLSGGDGHDYLQGNKGEDNLSGGAGNDTIRGGADNDHMLAGDGNDLLMGDAGDDNMSGGAGTDTLIGGEGADVFRFNNSDAVFEPNGSIEATDRITDFVKGTDHLVLSFAVSSVIVGTEAIYFHTVAGAAEYAASLMAGHAGDHEVVALAVGTDTMLFYAHDGSETVDAAIRLNGFDHTTADLRLFA